MRLLTIVVIWILGSHCSAFFAEPPFLTLNSNIRVDSLIIKSQAARMEIEASSRSRRTDLASEVRRDLGMMTTFVSRGHVFSAKSGNRRLTIILRDAGPRGTKISISIEDLKLAKRAAVGEIIDLTKVVKGTKYSVITWDDPLTATLLVTTSVEGRTQDLEILRRQGFSPFPKGVKATQTLVRPAGTHRAKVWLDQPKQGARVIGVTLFHPNDLPKS